ncbi:glycoside hydrolase family 88 protein [uncultured Arcticibacterium sp.]|uniref:glycoside hydrolase family 88/105 protein n=1 Tax=uncultured Arcticibacterium sp. TaxID=2173042 RepID=UPI0030F62FD1
MKQKLILLLTLCGINFAAFAQENWSEKMALSFMKVHADSIAVKEGKPARWDYEQGLMLKAIEKVWRRTADPKYFNYIRNDIDRYVGEDGSIRTYPLKDYNLDNIATGRALMLLYQQSLPNKEKYRKAADHLWEQLEGQPLTEEGGYWHKKRYPYQMWLDGLFMAEPFSAEYSKVFNHPEHFDHIAKQFALIEKYAVDPATGLIYHGYDESREQDWADKKTGLSPHFWGRAIGWYAMALVDVLDYFPENHPERITLINNLKRLAPVLTKYQDTESGVWYQMTALAGKEGNYLESSSSCMFAYTLLKGARMGYIDHSFKNAGVKAFNGIIKEFISNNPDGTINVEKAVSVGGLGGNPYRDGTYEYYLSEPIRLNDLKGVGPFIFAAIEMELLEDGSIGKGKKVGLDYHFNKEFREGYNGEQEQFHYIWEDKLHSGFNWFGEAFTNMGAEITAVKSQASKEALKGLDVYIIVDPDDKKETDTPNYIAPSDIKNIKKWVKKGGTLLIMTNDAEHCNLVQVNDLTSAFGISFSDKNINMVKGLQFDMGSVKIAPRNEIFKNSSEVYIKELVTLNTDSNAKTILSKGSDKVMVSTSYKKGRVMVIGDPWLYNEYVDGRKLPAKYQNFEASKDLAKWLLK